jgi:predicted AAA+ superfamily ATPase
MRRIYLDVAEEHFNDNTQALFLSGPRQVGKTTIAKAYLKEAVYSKYLNWDNLDHRQIILSGPSAVIQGLPLKALVKQKPVICFDEIHKFKNWKGFLKGFIDTYRDECQTLVTGSARLDVFNKSGDSLMGRYFLYRVHPFSINELINPSLRDEVIGPPRKIEDDVFEALLTFGGFPDPFIKGEKRYYKRWQNLRQQQFFQEDIRDLSSIHELALLEVLATLLKRQVGQLANYTTLAQRVRVSDQTIRRWMSVFESLYFCFTIRPWAKNVSRSLLKEPKVYLWDWSQVEDIGQRTENFIASHLLKAIHFWNDSGFGNFNLYFLRTKDQKEVDFLVAKDNKPWLMIEVKSSGTESLSSNLLFFQKQLNVPHVLQVAMDLPYVEEDCFSIKKPMIVPAKTFLSQLI